MSSHNELVSLISVLLICTNGWSEPFLYTCCLVSLLSSLLFQLAKLTGKGKEWSHACSTSVRAANHVGLVSVRFFATMLPGSIPPRCCTPPGEATCCALHLIQGILRAREDLCGLSDPQRHFEGQNFTSDNEESKWCCTTPTPSSAPGAFVPPCSTSDTLLAGLYAKASTNWQLWYQNRPTCSPNPSPCICANNACIILRKTTTILQFFVW